MKISIILPVYNVAKYISDCLSSLLCQDISKEDYEIICVDDGSTDGSVDIIKEYIIDNNNIKLVSQENSGVCIARNNGFKIATGKYIWFVDPDDYISSNCLGKMIELLEVKSADLITFNYFNVDEDSQFVPEKQIEINVKEQNGYSSKGGGCQYICRRQYLIDNDITYHHELAYGEDYLWAFQVNYRKHIGLETDAKIYFYRQRQGSAMRGKSTGKQIRHKNDMYKLALIYKQEYCRCQKEGLPKKVLKEIKNRIHLCVQSVVLDLVKLSSSKEELKAELKKMKDDGMYPYPLLFWVLFNKNIDMPKSARFVVLFFPFRWYVLLLNKLYRKLNKKG